MKLRILLTMTDRSKIKSITPLKTHTFLKHFIKILVLRKEQLMFILLYLQKVK